MPNSLFGNLRSKFHQVHKARAQKLSKLTGPVVRSLACYSKKQSRCIGSAGVELEVMIVVIAKKRLADGGRRGCIDAAGRDHANLRDINGWSRSRVVEFDVVDEAATVTRLWLGVVAKPGASERLVFQYPVPFFKEHLDQPLLDISLLIGVSNCPSNHC